MARRTRTVRQGPPVSRPLSFSLTLSHSLAGTFPGISGKGRKLVESTREFFGKFKPRMIYGRIAKQERGRERGHCPFGPCGPDIRTDRLCARRSLGPRGIMDDFSRPLSVHASLSLSLSHTLLLHCLSLFRREKTIFRIIIPLIFEPKSEEDATEERERRRTRENGNLPGVPPSPPIYSRRVFEWIIFSLYVRY